jgi:hypothetical protein
LEILFDVTTIPCTEQIKNIIDDVDPTELEPVFDRLLEYADKVGIIEQYRVLD